MRKLRLDLDRLRVQSFDTGGMAVADVRGDDSPLCSKEMCFASATTEGNECRGTVQAHAASRNPDYCAMSSESECCSYPCAVGTGGCDCYGTERC